MTKPPPFNLPTFLFVSIGICSDALIYPYGFSGYPIPGATPFGSLPLLISCYWNGASWNGLLIVGRRLTSGTSADLFPDVPGVQRLAVGVCIWWDGTKFVCGVNVAEFPYERATNQSGILFPSFDYDPGCAPYPVIPSNPTNVVDAGGPPAQITPTPGVLALSPGCPQLPPLRTFAYPNDLPPYTPFVYGSYTHQGFDGTEDNPFDGPYSLGGSFQPKWVPIFSYEPYIGLSAAYFCAFARFSMGSYHLSIYALYCSAIF